MEFLFKETIWASVTVPEEKEQEILELIKSEQITSAEDIFQHIDDAEYNTIDNTSEPLSVEENGFQSTIEVIDISFPNGKLNKTMIWENVQPEEEEDSNV